MDTTFYVFILLIFVSVVFLLEGAYLTWNAYKGPEINRIERRLRAMSAGAATGEASLLKERLLSDTRSIERLLLRVPRIRHLDRLLLQSGLEMNVGTLMAVIGGAAFAGFILANLFAAPLPVALLSIVVGGGIPLMYVTRRRRKRLIRMEEQLPDAMDLMGRALRVGNSLPNSIKMIADEMSDPLATEFRVVFDEVNYGFSMHDALMNLANRVPLTDLRYFVLAVLIQRETGGNLAELLDNIAALIRARFKLMGTIRVLSAEGRLSAWVLTILPFALAGVISLINPGFLAVLWTDPAGTLLIWLCLIMMAVGIFWMRRIIRIRV
jgi:tight adherence protein B